MEAWRLGSTTRAPLSAGIGDVTACHDTREVLMKLNLPGFAVPNYEVKFNVFSDILCHS